jgi:hypothetical protein
MSDACARSGRNVSPARRAVLAADASDKGRLKRQDEMVKALDRLGLELSRCQADFEVMSRPGEGEKVRGYANPRAVQVLTAVRQYERVLASFFVAMGIKVTPLGARARPAAG